MQGHGLPLRSPTLRASQDRSFVVVGAILNRFISGCIYRHREWGSPCRQEALRDIDAETESVTSSLWRACLERYASHQTTTIFVCRSDRPTHMTFAENTTLSLNSASGMTFRRSHSCRSCHASVCQCMPWPHARVLLASHSLRYSGPYLISMTLASPESFTLAPFIFNR